MIINKTINVKLANNKMKNFYHKKGYIILPESSIIEVKIEDIPKHSRVKIDVICNKCNSSQNITYTNYTSCITKSNDGNYYCKLCSYINRNNTNLYKYGSKSPLADIKIIKKSKETMIAKFGVDNISKVNFIKEERSEAMKINTDSYNIKIYDKYGSNVSKLDWVKEKKKETTLKNWGVENPSQNPFLFEKAQITGKKIKLHEIGLYYRGTYEKDFLNYCQNNNIPIEKGPSICFLFLNKKKYYHSDFYIKNENLIIEVKSSYYYEKYKDLNIEKEKAAINNGYNFLFAIDKNYSQLQNFFKIKT